MFYLCVGFVSEYEQELLFVSTNGPVMNWRSV